MPISKLREEFSSIVVSTLVLLASGSATSAESTAPIRVRHSISIRSGNWIPLPVEDMRRAAGDAALSRLTDAGRLAFLDPQQNGSDEDELRYGLPLFEAQQGLNQLGRLSLPGQQGPREQALSRAENLYRQIQAENPSNVQRVTESQHALDSLIVMRGARAKRYKFSAPDMPVRVELRCNDSGIEIVESERGSSRFPAAFR